jgi:hypothetical protein
MDIEELKDGCRLSPPYSLEEVAYFANALLGTLQNSHPEEKVLYVSDRRNFDIVQIEAGHFSRSNAGEFIATSTSGKVSNIGSLTYFCPTSPVVARLKGDSQYIENINLGILDRLTSPVEAAA